MNQLIYFDGQTVHGLGVDVYPDNSPLVKWAGGSVERMLLRPITMSGFLAGLFWAQAIAERGRKVPHLILPFVPGARQDRLNDTGDYLFTAKSVARLINSCGFPSVTVLDPHSDVTPALIDRCRVTYAEPPVGKYDAVIAPDAGAEKRATKAANHLSVPVFHAWKTRDVATGAIAGFGAESMPDTIRNVLVVDDICDGGGTFVGLGEVLRSRGVTADLFVTHGIFSKGTGSLEKYFARIFCTDSFADTPPRAVTVINTCQRLLEEGVSL